MDETNGQATKARTIPSDAAWVCVGCGAYSKSPNLNFPMMHEHENVEPAAKAVLAWGRAFGIVG